VRFVIVLLILEIFESVLPVGSRMEDAKQLLPTTAAAALHAEGNAAEAANTSDNKSPVLTMANLQTLLRRPFGDALKEILTSLQVFRWSTGSIWQRRVQSAAWCWYRHNKRWHCVFLYFDCSDLSILSDSDIMCVILSSKLGKYTCKNVIMLQAGGDCLAETACI